MDKGTWVGDCKTLVQSKNEGSHFDKAGPQPGGWLATCGYGKQLHTLKDLVMAQRDFGYVISAICSRTWEESHIPV